MGLENLPQQAIATVSEPGLWGTLATVGVGVTMVVGVISIVFEVAAIIFLLTPSENDDKFLGKLKKGWLRIKPLLELFHVKTPMLLVLNKVLKRIKNIREALEKHKKSDEGDKDKETQDSNKPKA